MPSVGLGYPNGFGKFTLLFMAKYGYCFKQLDKRWRHPSRAPTRYGLHCRSLCPLVDILKNDRVSALGCMRTTSSAPRVMRMIHRKLPNTRSTLSNQSRRLPPANVCILAPLKKTRKRMKAWRDSNMGCSRAVKENFWVKPFSSKLFCLHPQVFPRFRGFVRDCGCGACGSIYSL